ncbi:hypothetical protein AGDE_10600 [Angomonas deanei]|nr:hypothetical protein AGDE_10600 [Angomonas deanei]|eukprot:EPY28002.1 hypothetical protein AGDE_10600 [Angomonas deanei]
MSTSVHALRDKWLFSYLPLLTADMVSNEYGNDWELASQEKTVRLDWVATVEELWSTVNSLPKIQSMPVGSTFILSRDGKEASFEKFPDGSRVVVNLHKSPATDFGLELIFAAVMGETIAEEIGATVCDVIRLAARPNKDFSELVRVEVWLNDAAYSGKVSAHIRTLFEDRQITPNLFHISENPFDGNKEKKAVKPAEAAREETKEEPEAAPAPPAAAVEEEVPQEAEEEAPQEAEEQPN